MADIVVDASNPTQDARIAYLRRGFVPTNRTKKIAHAVFLQRARMVSFDIGWEIGWRRASGENLQDVEGYVPVASIANYQKGLASGLAAWQEWRLVLDAKVRELARRQEAIEARPCPTARRSRA